MTVNVHYRLAEGVLAQTSLSEAVLLDAQGGHYFAANPVATVLLRELLAGSDLEAIIRHVHQTFEQDEAIIRADVVACLEDWLHRGLIVTAAAVERRAGDAS